MALGLAEAVLQLAGVEVRAGRLDRDPALGWRNRPGWRGPRFSVNSRGFLGPEFAPEKPPGTFRVVCLGDSCTAGDFLPSPEDSYPRQIERALRGAHPERRIEVINAGVGGYSSFQGRLWLEREILGFEPDVVLLYFGWNDHWAARLGGPDKEVSDSWSERTRAWLSWCKLLQLTIKAYHVLRGHDPLPARDLAAPDAPTSGRPPRVSQDDYAENLRAMIRAVRERGGRVAVITAPNYLELIPGDRRPVPEAFRGDRGAVEALVALHAAYNETASRVARQEGACLVDMAMDFVAAPQPAGLFWDPPNDFIHLSRAGYVWLVRAIMACPDLFRPGHDRTS